MQSHKFELDLEFKHYDKHGKLKNSYLYPFQEREENTVTFQVKNPDNSVVNEQTFPVRSFVTGCLRFYSAAWGGNGDNFIDTSGAPVGADGAQNFSHIDATTDDATFGVWVGYGAVSTSISSYAASNQCASGSGANQLSYRNTVITGPTATASGQRLTVKREFVNLSGNTITITSSGVLAKTTGIDAAVYLMVVDTTDINTTVINIPIVNGQTLAVTYNFDITTSGDYTTNFLNCLRTAFGSSSLAIKPTTYTSGTPASVILANLDQWRADAGATVDTWGIVVGTGSAAKNIDDFKLGGQCASGSGLNQVEYSTTTGEALTVTSPTAQFSLLRSFTNNSASSISIAESGIYLHGDNAPIVNTQDNKKICVVRSTFTPVSIGVGETFQLRYTMRIAH